MRFFIYLLVFLFARNIHAQYGSIAGQVVSSDSLPLDHASIQIDKTEKGAITDKDGQFQIRKVNAGMYSVTTRLVGLEAVTRQVEVVANQVTHLDFVLTETETQLNEVLITANQNYKSDRVSNSLRLATPILKTPQNIQVINRQLLADQQVFDMLEGVTRNVSGVTYKEHWGSYANLQMRASRVSAFRNGMNVDMPWGPITEDMSMVERVEFVKGPAGFMLASGDPSGFYNVVTKKPTGQNRHSATLSLGSFDTFRSTLDLDGKLSSNGKLLYRLNLMGQFKGSFRPYDYNNRFTIAPVLRYRFNEKTTLTAEYTYQYSKMAAIGSAYIFSPGGYADLPRNFSQMEPSLEPSDLKDHSVFLTVEHALDTQWKLTAQLAYFRFTQVGSSLWPISLDSTGIMERGVSNWDAFNEAKLGQAFVNGEVHTGPVRHRILGGLDMSQKYYYADWNQDLTLRGAEPFNVYNPVFGDIPLDSMPRFDRSRSLIQRAAENIISQSYLAGYVQDELAFLNDRLRLTLAGRVTHLITNRSGTKTNDTKFTPRLGFSFSVDENTSIYGLYDQAFKQQAGTDVHKKPFDPVTGDNIEAGIKRDWMNGKWNTTISAYRIYKNNVLAADPENPNFSIQLGQIQAKGIEFDLRGEIVEGLSAIWNYALTDARVTKDTDESRIGKPQAGYARHNTNGWLTYKLSNGFGVSLGYSWQLERSPGWNWDASIPVKPLPNYFVLNSAIYWAAKDFGINLNVNNLLDAYLYSGAPYGNYYYWQSDPPRNFRLTMTYNF